MIIVEEHITVKKEHLILTNQRAIYWPRENALILSDLHVGKTGHFKKHGIPMPDAILQNDLNRLEALIHQFKVEKLIVVGDLFHAEFNNDMETFKKWLMVFSDLRIVLIKGNHDRLSAKTLEVFSFQLETELLIKPFLFTHQHLDTHNELFTVSGHTHPGVLIRGKAKQKLKLPCYQVTTNQIVLPAFSLFTGLNYAAKIRDCVYYAFTENAIFKFE